MLKSHWVLAAMILGIVPPAWGQDAQGSFFHRAAPAPVAPPLASPTPPAIEASPIPVPQPPPPIPAPPVAVQLSPPPAASIQIEPVIDHCGSNRENVLQFVRIFFSNGSGSARAVLSYQERTYADLVNYYGKATSRAAVLKQKEAYLNRWPIRTYALSGNGDIRCNEATGTYDFAGVIDWKASNPSISNGVVKSGAAIVRLGISAVLTDALQITRESSEVTERHPDQPQ